MQEGIHPMLFKKTKERYAEVSEELLAANKALQEASKFGDLSENAEYDAARSTLGRVMREKELLDPITDMPQIFAREGIAVIEEGSVLSLKIYNVTIDKLDVDSAEFQTLIKEDDPQFKGIILYGGVLPVHSLLQDSALSLNTPIGSFLLGKYSGYYSVQVPGGFSNLYVKLLSKEEYSNEEIKCEYGNSKE